MTTPDAASLQILISRLTGIAEEMGGVLRRGAFSANIKERADCSAAVFTADGDGNLTAITDDLIIASQAGLNTPATGIYKINSDGTGFLQFKFNGGASAQYRITLSDDAHFYLAREQGFSGARYQGTG